MRPWGPTMAVAAVLAATAAAQSGPAQRSGEESARNLYRSGLDFVRQQKHGEALKDFETVVLTYPTSSVADDALLEIVRHHLDVAIDLDAAQKSADLLLKQYRDTGAAPMAQVFLGRIALARRKTPTDIEGALAIFDRVPRLHARDDAVAPSHYYAGEALRVAGKHPEALARYRQVLYAFPRSQWAPRAQLALAVGLVRQGEVAAAMAELQSLRLRFRDHPAARTALAWNTILYRLYVRPPAEMPFSRADRALAPSAGKFRDVVGLAIDAGDRIFVATRAGVAVLADDGRRPVPGGGEPRGLFFDGPDRPVVVTRAAFHAGSDLRSFAIPRTGEEPRRLDNITAGAVLSNRELLVADGGEQTVHRFSPLGEHLGALAKLKADRLLVTADDEIIGFDRSTDTVTVMSRDGRALGKIEPRGGGYQLRNPTDVATDPLGHVYVLDRGAASVFVFVVHPRPRVLCVLETRDAPEGDLREAGALAIDSAGRLVVYDGRTQQLLVYE